MRMFQAARILTIFHSREAGVTFIETLVALTLLGIIAVAFLTGLATTSRATIIADEQTTAESLARAQMEWIKNTEYVYSTTEYSPAPMPNDEEYANYSVAIAAEPLRNPDDGIQKVTITIKHFDKEVIKLEGYKVDR